MWKTLITDKRDVVDRPKLDWTECECCKRSSRIGNLFFEEEYLTSCVSSIISYNSLDIIELSFELVKWI